MVLGHLAKPFDRDEKHGNRLVGSLRFENGVELRGQRQTVRQAGSGVAGERPAAFGEISLEFGHALRTGFQGVLQSILFVHQTACRFAQPRGVVRELRQADDRVSCQPTGEMIEFGLECLLLRQRKLERAGHVGEGFLGCRSRPVRGEGYVGDEVVLEAQSVQ